MGKQAKFLEPEEIEEAMERGGLEWGENLDLDLHRSVIALDEDGQEAVRLARENLLALLDIITASVPPEPSEEHLEFVHTHCRHAIHMRNIVRAVFLKSEGHELPEKWERLEGTVH